MGALPPYEQATVDLDLAVVERWVAEHPALGGEVVIPAVRRTRDELVGLLSRPEHLRVVKWRWMPDAAEIEAVRPGWVRVQPEPIRVDPLV